MTHLFRCSPRMATWDQMPSSETPPNLMLGSRIIRRPKLRARRGMSQCCAIRPTGQGLARHEAREPATRQRLTGNQPLDHAISGEVGIVPKPQRPRRMPVYCCRKRNPLATPSARFPVFTKQMRAGAVPSEHPRMPHSGILGPLEEEKPDASASAFSVAAARPERHRNPELEPGDLTWSSN